MDIKKILIPGLIGLGLILFLIFGIVFSSGDDDNKYDIYISSGNDSTPEHNLMIKTLREPLVGGSSDSQSMLLLGDAYYEIDNMDSAFVWYSNAYNLGERSAHLSQRMAEIQDNKGNVEEAVSYYRETLSYDSAQADVYRRLAELDSEYAPWYLEKAEQYPGN